MMTMASGKMILGSVTNARTRAEAEGRGPRIVLRREGDAEICSDSLQRYASTRAARTRRNASETKDMGSMDSHYLVKSMGPIGMTTRMDTEGLVGQGGENNSVPILPALTALMRGIGRSSVAQPREGAGAMRVKVTNVISLT